MSIAKQFAGLQMDQLIGAPLTAAADASQSLANSTAEFIDKVGFDSTGNVREVEFKYNKQSPNEDGTTNLDMMKVNVPMLAIVPIPNLQVDEVNVLFDMEVKSSDKHEDSTDISSSFTGSAKLGIFKVAVSGSVSSHSSNTRSTDNSAKYHVDVRATNHGTPEGLSRVLDMMAANVAPSLIDSSLRDGNGQELSESAKLHAEKLKALRQEQSQIETKLSAARNTLEVSIGQLIKTAKEQLNVYQVSLNEDINNLELEDADESNRAKAKEDAANYSNEFSSVSATWNNLQNQAGDIINMLLDSQKGTEAEAIITTIKNNKVVSTLFGLKSYKDKKAHKYENDDTYYDKLCTAQNNSELAQLNVKQLEKELFDKKSEYNNEISK